MHSIFTKIRRGDATVTGVAASANSTSEAKAAFVTAESSGLAVCQMSPCRVMVTVTSMQHNFVLINSIFTKVRNGSGDTY